MADQPGSETGVINPANLSNVDQNILANTHYLKELSESRTIPLERTYLKALASNMRSVSNRYAQEVLPLFTNKPSQEQYSQVLESVEKWRSGKDPSCFNQIPATADMFKDNLANNYGRIRPLYANLNHDANVVFTPVLATLSHHGDFDYMLDPVVLKWPQHVMERVARQVEKAPQIEQVKPQEIFENLDSLFKVLATEDPGFHLQFSVDQEITSIKADRYYFEGAVFNLIRNSQNALRKRSDFTTPGNIHVSMNLVDGKVILQVRDNAGGFPPDMLEKTKDANGKELPYQKAFMREITANTGGSGLGLDIVREVTMDHLHGSVRAFNENYTGTEQLGAVVEMTFPQL